MAHRVGIARALTVQPEILVLDEPLGGAGRHDQDRMQEELARIWREENVTMVMVTHDLEEAIYLVDRALILPKDKGGAARLIDIDMPRDAVSNSCARSSRTSWRTSMTKRAM